MPRRVIVATSGGKASAWCAFWAVNNFNRSDIILYFNDTKWEHPDLYRFLNDLSDLLRIPIHCDADGRSPEDLFIEQRCLANDRMPFCSRILKAERLQRFYKDGDILIFGIYPHEHHRISKIVSRYQVIAAKTNRFPQIKFPLCEECMTPKHVNAWLKSTRIKQPHLYQIGFPHNNCSGGCVRQGKKCWRLLYEKLPEIYERRAWIERRVSSLRGKKVHFCRDVSLDELKDQINLGRFESNPGDTMECFGVCNTQN